MWPASIRCYLEICHFYGKYSSLKKDLATSLAVVYLPLRENQKEFFFLNKMIEKVHWIFSLIISIPVQKVFKRSCRLVKCDKVPTHSLKL